MPAQIACHFTWAMQIAPINAHNVKQLNKGAVMAFSLKQIEPVQFGDKWIEPELDAERKLRLGRINYQGGEALEKKSDETIASCFPSDEAFVLDYLKKCPASAKNRLAVYLTSGEDGVKAIETATEKVIANEIAKGRQ